MSEMSIARGNPLQLTEEEEAAIASLKATVRHGRHARGREGRELSLATLTVVGGLSLGAVGGLAYLSEERFSWLPASGPAPASRALASAKHPPVSGKAADPDATSAPFTIKVASRAGTEATPSHAPELAATISAHPLLSDPIETASIAPAVRLPPMALPPGLPAEPITAAQPEAQTVEAPVSPPPARMTQPAVSPAEAEGYLTKAEAAFRSGDLIVARSFFERLAQAGDPRGALGMARTYDGVELSKVPVFGLKADDAIAERWRARAQKMTSAVARK
jgi:hypothetical protein